VRLNSGCAAHLVLHAVVLAATQRHGTQGRTLLHERLGQQAAQGATTHGWVLPYVFSTEQQASGGQGERQTVSDGAIGELSNIVCVKGRLGGQGAQAQQAARAGTVGSHGRLMGQGGEG